MAPGLFSKEVPDIEHLPLLHANCNPDQYSGIEMTSGAGSRVERIDCEAEIESGSLDDGRIESETDWHQEQNRVIPVLFLTPIPFTILMNGQRDGDRSITTESGID
ncbi:hypothetical protein EVAR_11366_1 [Eumeta japonica]|uniref:Uncharacterized protein n=1 Tax=Eumeta variegata TaxID=151549 RepID=A0A4C1U2B6_EUMVA|nr:hypothetical protein EVAR_11366_1 [Eumeta japonica]